MEAAVENLVAISFMGPDALFLKARPVQDGGKRFIYCEASNEATDDENQGILKKALMASAPFFLAQGNLDLEHMTVVGHRLGKENPRAWEVGQPAEVREGDGSRGILVKGRLYEGGPGFTYFGGSSAADYFWKTLHQDPPMRWFPSVAGPIPEGGLKKVCKNGICRQVVTKCVWKNLGFATAQHNLSLAAVSTVPFGEFAKGVLLAETNACDGEKCSCSITKALTAGHGTDVSGLSGGQALQRQSIEGNPLDPWGHAIASFVKALYSDACEHTQPDAKAPTIASLTDHFARCQGLDDVSARRCALRFANQLRSRSEQSRAAA